MVVEMIPPIFINCSKLPKESSAFELCFCTESTFGPRSFAGAHWISRSGYFYPTSIKDVRKEPLLLVTTINSTNGKLNNKNHKIN